LFFDELGGFGRAFLDQPIAIAMDFLKQLFGLGSAEAPEAEPDMIGWVVLSNTDVELTVDSVRATLDALFPAQFLPANERNFVIEGAVPDSQFMIQSNVAGAAGMFMLHSVPGPYTEFSDFAQAIADPGLRKLAIAQQAWLAVDAMHVHTTEADAYRLIGAVLAKLAPPDAAVLVHPSRPIVMRFDGDVRSRLASGFQPT
jgi:hypothetical protein